MRLFEALEKVNSSKEYKDWSKQNKSAYLCHAFRMEQETNWGDWQIGYYDESSDKITPIIVGNMVVIGEAQEVFKRPEDKVLELDMEKVELNMDKAIELADKFKEKEYPKELCTKKICILQNLPEFGHVWNLTYVSSSFNTINFKIDTSSGEIKEHKIRNLMEFRAS